MHAQKREKFSGATKSESNPSRFSYYLIADKKKSCDMLEPNSKFGPDSPNESVKVNTTVSSESRGNQSLHVSSITTTLPTSAGM